MRVSPAPTFPRDRRKFLWSGGAVCHPETNVRGSGLARELSRWIGSMAPSRASPLPQAHRLNPALALLVLVLVLPAQADVFLHRDADGVEHYTNVAEQASQDGYERIVAVLVEQGQDNRAEAKPVVAAVGQYAADIEAVAQEYKVDKALVHAVITAESGYNPAAVSRTGAQGLMQLMPGTAKRYAVKVAFDPTQNIRGGTRYLRDLLDLFGNDVQLAVAAYNAGENAVIKYGRKIPPYRETQAYVPKVLRLYSRYAALM